MELSDDAANKCRELHVLLSSTPTPQTWKTARELITAGEDIEWRGDSRETLLHLVPTCARSSSSVDYLIPVIYQLADAGIDVGAVDVDGNTPLHVSVLCEAGHRMAIALSRIGVVADIRNNAGKTAADLALQLGQQSVVAVLNAAASGLWNAVMDGDQETARKLVESLWFSVDLRRNGTSLLTEARTEDGVPDNLIRTVNARSQYIRLMHAALAGNVDAVRLQLQYFDSRDLEQQLQDHQYHLDDGTVTEWPLLAQVLQLRLTDVARVLIKQANFDVNAIILVDGGRKVPLFQWAVHLVVQIDVTIFELILERADVSLIVGPAEFIYELWERRYPALLFDRLAARDPSLVSLRDGQGRTLRDRVLLDAIQYGAVDVVRISVLYVDEFVLHLVKTGEVSSLERLVMAGYEHINVVDRQGKSAMQLAADAELSSVVEFLDKLPQFQVSFKYDSLRMLFVEMTITKTGFDESS